MENISELLATGNSYLDVAITFVSAATAWLAAKLAWWKNQPKLLKAVIAIGVFLGVAITLSLITALLN